MRLARLLSITLSLILTLAISPLTHAASITPADFISPYVDDFTGLGLPYTIHTNLSPLVRPEGVYTFTTSTGTTFRYNNLGGPPYFGETISTDDQIGTISLTLTTPTARAGVYLLSSSGTIQFFSPSNTLLATLPYSPPGAFTFYGWEDTTQLVSRILITDNNALDGAITFLDRTTIEAVPLPAPLAAFIPLAAIVLVYRKQNSRAHAYA